MKVHKPGRVFPKRSVIIDELAECTDIPRVQAIFIYNSLWNILLKQLKQGSDVMLPGIGRLQFIPSRKDQVSNLTGQVIPNHKRLRFNINVGLGLFIRTNTRVRPIV